MYIARILQTITTIFFLSILLLKARFFGTVVTTSPREVHRWKGNKKRRILAPIGDLSDLPFSRYLSLKLSFLKL